METQEREILNEPLQELLDNAGFDHVIAIDKDNVKCVVDDEWEFFSRDDVMSGHPMSGLAFFGGVNGDHRMIAAIAEDMETVFEILK